MAFPKLIHTIIHKQTCLHYILLTYVNYTPCYYLVIVCLCACVCTLKLLHIDFVYILISYTKNVYVRALLSSVNIVHVCLYTHTCVETHMLYVERERGREREGDRETKRDRAYQAKPLTFTIYFSQLTKALHCHLLKGVHCCVCVCDAHSPFN